MIAELTNYIIKAREKKVTDEEIKNNLIANGWSSEQVAQALSQTANIPIPPPPVIHVGMWTGFLYILFFISLYVLSTAIGGILHIWINKTIMNVTDNTYTDSTYLSFFNLPSVVRGYLSAIIVTYPLFLILALTLKKQLVKQPMVQNLRSRKLLIYITLIGTFLIMLGDVIAISYDFLSGSITGNALGHLLVTLLIAGSIFGYFISEVKNDRKTV
ncbi:MAG TPA: DUF5671 domain-containing protein [Candidatus Sulfotelmatobacter sp.]|jgi:hypothetical protein|nr:DUF5671 domain-containing protein [Candidatus Sulfotelmatobacter sp.]